MILVIDDDVLVLQLARKILERAGYGVLTAEDGIEALDLYKAREEEIALVFCDMVLPRLGGMSLFLQLREINPKVKVIFTSAYLEAEAKRNLMNVGAIDFIQKPYIPEQILNSIRAALSSP